MNIKVSTQKKELEMAEFKGKTLLQGLQENQIAIAAHCQGNGTCGKCKIKVVSGQLPITETDRQKLTKEELTQGIRLACKVKIENRQSDERDGQQKKKTVIREKTEDGGQQKEEQLVIEILGGSEDSIVVEGITPKKEMSSCFQEGIHEKTETQKWKKEETVFFIAVDIGTTTIAMALVEKETGEVFDTYTTVNHQRSYGADVISRIVVSNTGKGKELKRLVEEDLWTGISRWIGRNISGIVIAGNTTMIHLLMGYSCESLGKYPFYSEHLKQIDCSLKDCITGEFVFHNGILEDGSIRSEMRSEFSNIPVTIFPGISPFVGGDIVADLLICPEFEEKEISLLLDLGTNGEMVLGNKEKLLVTSTAAGPAFEGGNISHGTASVPGSICQVKIQNQRAVVRTIREEMPPIGICGTGLISAVAQLKHNKLVNEQGELSFPYAKNGYPLWIYENGDRITLSQNDIREFQMAKAAIRAGIEILMEEFGCKEEEIHNIFIAGGFGKALHVEDVITLGMIPEWDRTKIKFIGNGALKGAICLGKKKGKTETIKKICERTKNVSLSQCQNFHEKYLEYMKL